MLARTGGRQYMAAHMRRGDFAVLGWSAKTIEEQTARVTARIADGFDKLSKWAREPPQTVAMDEEPLLSVMSERTRMV